MKINLCKFAGTTNPIAMNRRLFLITSYIIGVATCGWAQAWQKMSPFVRQAALESQTPTALCSPSTRQKAMSQGVLTAFVRTDGDGQQTLARYGCRQLASFGNVSSYGAAANNSASAAVGVRRAFLIKKS